MSTKKIVISGLLFFSIIFPNVQYAQVDTAVLPWLAKPQFDEAYDFNGAGWIKKGGKFGFITKEGTIVQPQFDEVYNFYDGVAKVKVGGKWGYIDREVK